MPITFYEEDWARVIHNTDRWWQGQLGRPLIQVRVTGGEPDRPEPALPYHSFAAFYDDGVSADAIVDRLDFELSRTEFLGDAFPHFSPNFGPGVLAAFLGARPENGLETVWFHPQRSCEIGELSFKPDPENIWHRRIIDLVLACQRRWGSLVQLGLTDLGGNLDILSAFRPGEQLLLDLYDHPDQVQRLTWEAHHAWWYFFEAYEHLYLPYNRGYSSWAGLLSVTPHYMLQCDFAYMIGPDMYRTFVAPELVATAERMDHAFYHLDGVGQLPHLDCVLAIDTIKGIQWVPGDGKAYPGCWPEVYGKILKANRLTQLFNSQCPREHWFDVLDILLKQTGCIDNVAYMLEVDVAHRDQAVKLLQKYGAWAE